MADAVGAQHAFFSTCGSSLSVKSALIAVAGPGEKLLLRSGLAAGMVVPDAADPKLTTFKVHAG